MKTILPFVVLCAAVLTVVTSQSCASRSNGCSIPYNLPYFFKTRFTPSCDKHDVCYECASYYGRTKNDCDGMLFNGANRVCSSMRKRFIVSVLTAAEKEFCKAISLSYYEAVSHFGGSHFPSSSASWCSQSWVRSCMP
ncbi:conodipine-P2-like [Haliotis rufescens]|uniref:conodipine-P2-like n=1 Tax=Haliotis rufescens TaxID=6454 RepID=UPI00201EC315|nr:conodipine-P2-like [Haliotis rufescens]